eukprot:scaffold4850_cov213-Pinguiococcus_pyrenoidosus.AAC.29
MDKAVDCDRFLIVHVYFATEATPPKTNETVCRCLRERIGAKGSEGVLAASRSAILVVDVAWLCEEAALLRLEAGADGLEGL